MLTADEQKFFDFAKGALPSWISNRDEFLFGAAKLFGSVKAMADYLFGQALIGGATGATADTPDWLNQHARDRGTARANAESDVALRARLRNFPDALTRSAILDAADAVLDAAGVTADAALVELPRDAAYLGSYASMTGTGGTFVQVGTVSKFTPTVLPWPAQPFRDASISPVLVHKLVIAGAANAGNNGTRTITGLEGNAALVANAGGMAGADPTVTWTAQHFDGSGNLTDGFRRAYVGRGYRCASARPLGLVLILPFGTDAGTAAGIAEMLRTKKAAGIRIIVERRVVP